MNLTRLALFVVAGCSLLLNPLRAQAPAPAPAPWAPDKQFSADQVITAKNGMTITTRMYVDNGRIRTDTNANGMNMAAIVLPAEKKMYSVLIQQKMVMEMPLNDERARAAAAATGGSSDSKFEVVGPDTVDGVACTKYKMTSGSSPKVFYWWINTATKTPVKMADADGSFTLVWKNYKVGPQDPALFQPPAGYQVMQMPAGVSMPDGGGSGGQ